MGSTDPSPDSIHLITIGAGLAGLSAAISTKIANPNHQVTVLESTGTLSEIGAGLQLTPNATRLFKPWGIYDKLAPLATFPESLTVTRYDGTKVLAHEPKFQEQIASRYPAPFWGMHRVDLQKTMAMRCVALGVAIRLSAKVTHVDFATSTITTANGEKYSCDVILCTDGLWSSTRAQYLGRPSPAKLTGDLAYRIVINTKDLTGPDAAELEKFIRSKQVNFWVGPRTHVVAYTMRAGKVYNIVLLCPDDLPDGISKTDGDIEEMKALFEGWDPILRKFLGQVRGVSKWKLMWLDGLEEWCNGEGTFWMAGDCCHPMLPYLAQGANSSLEDGAVLGFLLGKVKNGEGKGEQLKKAAGIYQGLRMERGRKIQEMTFLQRDDFHMVDGAEQERRDELMVGVLGRDLDGVEGLREKGFPSRWTCPRDQRWLYGYDAYKVVEEAFSKDPY